MIWDIASEMMWVVLMYNLFIVVFGLVSTIALAFWVCVAIEDIKGVNNDS